MDTWEVRQVLGGILGFAILVVWIAVGWSWYDTARPIFDGPPELTEAHDLAIADALNDYRVSVGLRPLKYDERLAGIALAQVDDMAANGYFSHFDQNQNSPVDLYEAMGMECGDNLLALPVGDPALESPQLLGEHSIELWVTSAGHRALLESPATLAGVGIASADKDFSIDGALPDRWTIVALHVC